MAQSYSPHPAGLQHPGVAQGHPMAPGHPQQVVGQPGMPPQMHMGVSGPGGPQVSQAGGLMGVMPPGVGGPGVPSAIALQHLNPNQAQLYQQQQQQQAQMACKSSAPRIYPYLSLLLHKLIYLICSCQPSDAAYGATTLDTTATATTTSTSSSASHDCPTIPNRDANEYAKWYESRYECCTVRSDAWGSKYATCTVTTASSATTSSSSTWLRTATSSAACSTTSRNYQLMTRRTFY